MPKPKLKQQSNHKVNNKFLNWISHVLQQRGSWRDINNCIILMIERKDNNGLSDGEMVMVKNSYVIDFSSWKRWDDEIKHTR